MSSITDVNSASVNSLEFTMDNAVVDCNGYVDLNCTTGLGKQITRIKYTKVGFPLPTYGYIPHAHREMKLSPYERHIPLGAVINIKTDTLVATTTTGSIVDDGNDNVYVVTAGLSIVDPLAGQYGRVMLKCNKPSTRALQVSGKIDSYGVYKGHNDIRSRLR